MRPDEHRRRRRRLLWGALPLWLTLFGLGLVLVVDDLNARASRAEFTAGDYGSAVAGFTVLERFHLVERWKAPFGLGTSRFMAGELPGALAALDRALAAAPEEHRCTVQINRAVVLETWADDAMTRSAELLAEADALDLVREQDPGATSLSGRSPDGMRQEARDLASRAEADYAEATEARQDPACDEQDEQARDQNQQSRDRLLEKQGQAEQQAQPEEGEGEQPVTPEEEEAQRQQELAERNAEAQAEAEALRQQQQQGGGTGTKGW